MDKNNLFIYANFAYILRAIGERILIMKVLM